MTNTQLDLLADSLLPWADPDVIEGIRAGLLGVKNARERRYLASKLEVLVSHEFESKCGGVTATDPH